MVFYFLEIPFWNFTETPTTNDSLGDVQERYVLGERRDEVADDGENAAETHGDSAGEPLEPNRHYE